ncbi:hypothetical protein LINPERPRIM_LOCUS21053, partial [Linum perenne]
MEGQVERNIIQQQFPPRRTQSRCSPSRMRQWWDVATPAQKRLLESRGLGFVQHLNVTNFKAGQLTWLINHFDFTNLILNVRPDAQISLTEDHIRRIYELPRGHASVFDQLNYTTEEQRVWTRHLGIQRGKATSCQLGDLEHQLSVETDDEKWFSLFYLVLLGNMFHPKSSQKVPHQYLGVIYGRRAHRFEEYNWCAFLLEVFRQVGRDDKGYIEADMCLLMLFYLDMVGLDGDSVPRIRPTVINWTQRAVNAQATRLEGNGGMSTGTIIQWQPEEEEAKAIGSRVVNADIRQYLTQDDTPVNVNAPGKGQLLLLQQEKEKKERVEKNKKQEAASKSRLKPEDIYPSAMPFTRLDIDHMSLDEVEERREWLNTYIHFHRGALATLLDMKQQCDDRIAGDPERSLSIERRMISEDLALASYTDADINHALAKMESSNKKKNKVPAAETTKKRPVLVSSPQKSGQKRRRLTKGGQL